MYAYAGNDPVNNVDPSGLLAEAALNSASAQAAAAWGAIQASAARPDVVAFAQNTVEAGGSLADSGNRFLVGAFGVLVSGAVSVQPEIEFAGVVGVNIGGSAVVTGRAMQLVGNGILSIGSGSAQPVVTTLIQGAYDRITPPSVGGAIDPTPQLINQAISPIFGGGK
jgi:hypothetical protein